MYGSSRIVPIHIMNFDLTVQNYRCFPDSYPFRLRIGPGFTGIIGVNNSGKSSILKFFYEFRNLFTSFVENNDYATSVLTRQSHVDFPNTVLDKNEEVFANQSDGDLFIRLTPTSVTLPHDGNYDPLDVCLELKVTRKNPYCSGRVYLGPEFIEFVEPEELVWKTYEPLNQRFIIEWTPRRLEIDLSEHFRIIDSLRRSLFIPSFRNAINIGGRSNYYDINIGEQFIGSWANYKGDTNNKSQSRAARQVEIQIRDIFGFDDFAINASSDRSTLTLSVNDEPFNLAELGSRLTQFILVLVTAAIRQPSFILIDEPESNLHPALQQKFLTTLGGYAQVGTLFATHNIGLARSVADYIYSIRQIENGVSEVRLYDETPRLSEILGELNFSARRAVGQAYDRVLLVEGPSDIKTYKEWLRLYEKDHVMILPLGGAGMISGNRKDELIEVLRISDTVSAVIDSERSDENDPIDKRIQGFVDLCRELDIACKVLDRRATENYLTTESVQAFKGSPKFTALGPYQNFKDVQHSWSKHQNWQIAKEMKRADLEETDLREFLNGL